MDRLDLYELAVFDSGIDEKEITGLPESVKGLSLKLLVDDTSRFVKSAIFLNRSKCMSRKEKLAILSHEKQHIDNSWMYSLNSDMRTVKAIERKTVLASIRELCPEKTLYHFCFDLKMNPEEISDELMVPITVVVDAINLYSTNIEWIRGKQKDE